MEVIIKKYRGNILDIQGHGVVAVVDSNGNTIYSKGNTDTVVYARSGAKLMQALAPLSLGAEKTFGFTEKHIAQICASHSGEQIHLDTVREILEKIGLDESYLQCGAHYPINPDVTAKMKLSGETPTNIHNNCSGKHSGMLTAAKLLNMPLENYYKKNNPLQNKINDIISTICDFTLDEHYIGTDGCGVPVHSMPIWHFAYGYARMSDETKLGELAPHAQKVIESIAAFPQYTSGTERLEYKILSKYPKKIILKSGAGGFMGGILPEKNIGLAIKAIDGNGEHRDLMAIELLKKLDIIQPEDYEYFDSLVSKDIKNHRGEIVGHTDVLL